MVLAVVDRGFESAVCFLLLSLIPICGIDREVNGYRDDFTRFLDLGLVPACPLRVERYKLSRSLGV
jgi:hypothetical protein